MAKLTPEEVWEIVDIEGLEYTLLYELDDNTIEDGPFKDTWVTAKNALAKVQTALEDIEANMPIEAEPNDDES